MSIHPDEDRAIKERRLLEEHERAVFAVRLACEQIKLNLDRITETMEKITRG